MYRACAVIHPSAQIHAGADIAEDVSVGAFSIIGEHVRIGRGTRIAANVVTPALAVITSCILSLSSAARRRIRSMLAKQPGLKSVIATRSVSSAPSIEVRPRVRVLLESATTTC